MNRHFAFPQLATMARLVSALSCSDNGASKKMRYPISGPEFQANKIRH